MLKLTETIEIETVDIHRREECEHYEECLHLAACKRWPSFSCRECDDYQAGEVWPVFVSHYNSTEEFGTKGLSMTQVERIRTSLAVNKLAKLVKTHRFSKNDKKRSRQTG